MAEEPAADLVDEFLIALAATFIIRPATYLGHVLRLGDLQRRFVVTRHERGDAIAERIGVGRV